MAWVLQIDAEAIDRFNEAHEAAQKELQERRPYKFLYSKTLRGIKIFTSWAASALFAYWVESSLSDVIKIRELAGFEIELGDYFLIWVFAAFGGGLMFVLVYLIHFDVSTRMEDCIYKKHLQPLVDKIVGGGVEWYYVGTVQCPARYRKRHGQTYLLTPPEEHKESFRIWAASL